jgi:hypothetical protein
VRIAPALCRRLYGLAVEELETSALIVDDRRYPVTVAARAIKRAAG